MNDPAVEVAKTNPSNLADLQAEVKALIDDLAFLKNTPGTLSDADRASRGTQSGDYRARLDSALGRANALLANLRYVQTASFEPRG